MHEMFEVEQLSSFAVESDVVVATETIVDVVMLTSELWSRGYGIL